MSASQNDLVLQIIKEQCAVEAVKICQFILQKSTATLFDLKENVFQDQQLLQDTMLVLVKMGYANFQKLDENHCEYSINQTNVISTIRHLSYLQIAQELFGSIARNIVQYFLINNASLSDIAMEEIYQSSKENLKNSALQQEIQQTFKQLVSKGYLSIHISLEDQKIDIDQVHFQPKSKQVQQETTQELAQQKKRKGKDKQVESEKEDADENEGKKSKQKLKSSKEENINLLGKIINNKIDNDDEPQDKIIQNKLEDEAIQNGIYKLNMRKFVNEIRIKYISELAKGQINKEEAKIVIQALLQLNKNTGQSDTMNITDFFTLQEICESIPDKVLGRNEKIVTRILEELKRDSLKFVKIQKKNNEDHFAVQISGVLQAMQNRHIELIIQRRYSQNHARIFRIMKHFVFLEDKKVNLDHISEQKLNISDISLLNLKETRAILNTLVQDGFLKFEEIREGQMANLLNPHYSFDQNAINDQIKEYYFKSLFNLKKRLEAEYEQLKELQDQQDDDKQSQEKYKLTAIKINKLEMGIMELDSGVMVFTQF